MSDSAPTVYDTNTLIQVVPNLKISQNWLLDMFFPNVSTSDSEYVSIDIDIGKRRMSPFVSPLVEGKVVEQRRMQTNVFKPPYIKDKRVPDLRKPLRRMIGERIGGNESAQVRMAANIEAEMTDQVDILNRRMEWMAASALRTGTLTVSGDGFDTSLIDFGRDAALTVTLGATYKWDAASPASDRLSPSACIEQWSNLMLKKSGAAPSVIVFTPTPWGLFIADPAVRDAVIFDTSRFGHPNKNQVQTAAEIQLGAQYKGSWGSFDLYVYNDWYVDENDVEQRMIPDGEILMGSPAIQGVRAFASIIDPEFNYTAMPYAPKIWTQKDPAQLFLMMQSAPLVIPSRVNATFKATVSASNST